MFKIGLKGRAGKKIIYNGYSNVFFDCLLSWENHLYESTKSGFFICYAPELDPNNE